METLIKRLQKLLDILRSSLIAIKIFEILFVIGIGIATNKMTADNASPGWAWFLVILALLYVAISILQLTALAIPTNIGDELRAKVELSNIQADLARKTEIYNYLADAVAKLNEKTCNLNVFAGSGDERLQYFCDAGLADTLASGIRPLIDNTNYVFRCNKSQYTIGVYLDYFLQTPNWEALPINESSLEDRGIILLKDQLKLGTIITKSLIHSPAAGDKLAIKQAIEAAYNNCEYRYEDITIHKKAFSIFSIAIPTVCEDGYASGVLFFIVEKITEPSDIGQVLNVFAKIMTNLLSRHIECMRSRIGDANSKHWEKLHREVVETLPETEALKQKASVPSE